MDIILQFLHFLEDFVLGATSLISWFVTPLVTFTGFTFRNGLTQISLSPLSLLSIEGLCIFIDFAIFKWLLS